MKRILLISLAFVFIVILMIVQKQRVPKLSDISSVDVHIGGEGEEESTNLVFSDPENVMQIRRIHSRLKHYSDQRVKTWPLDVEMRYHLDSGETRTYTFKKIKPVSDYFSEIYDSLEYKHQVDPIFSISSDDISHVVLRDCYIDRKVEHIVTDNKIINALLSQSLQSKDQWDNDAEYYPIAEIEFYNGEKVIARSMILREQDIWYETLKADKALLDIYVGVDEIAEVMITNEDSNEIITTKDSEIIKQVLNHYYGWHSNQSSPYSVEIIMKDSSMRHWFGSFLNGDIPEEIEGLFE